MKTLEEARKERKEAEQRKEEMKKRQMILTLPNSGDTARIRFLREIDPLIDAKKHEMFNSVVPEESVRAMCAATYGKHQLCFWCAMFRKRKDNALKPRGVYIYPVWVLEVSNPEMAEDDRSFYEELEGFRLLVLNEKSAAAAALESYHMDEGSVLGCDWKYTRIGTRKDTKYTLTPKAPSSFDASDIPTQTVDDILFLMNEAYPYRLLSE